MRRTRNALGQFDNSTSPLIDRLLSNVQVTAEGCWIFVGAKVGGPFPYGVLGRGRRDEGNVLAHRATYEHFIGPIPDGMDLDHLCRTPPCCNPTHVEPVTRSINNLRGRRALAWRKP